MKRITLLLAGMIAGHVLFAQQQYTVKGTVKHIPFADYMYIAHDWTATDNMDSVPIINGNFKFKGVIKEDVPKSVFLYVRYKEEKKKYLVTDFFLEKGNTTINVQGIGFRDSAVVKGTPTNEDYKVYLQLKNDHLKKMAAFTETSEYQALSKEERIKKQRDAMNVLGRQFVKNHPASYFSLFLMQSDLLRVNEPYELLPLFRQLALPVQQSSTGLAFEKMMISAGQIKVGVKAPEFSEKDTLGNIVSLSDFKGKYILVDFWASWCHPCRAENPNLLAAYEHLKDKNFTILSVSMDQSKKAWIKAINDDHLPWEQISGLNPETSESAVKYGVKAIPRNFLIDPTGKIIAMDLRGDKISSTIEALIK